MDFSVIYALYAYVYLSDLYSTLIYLKANSALSITLLWQSINLL